MKTLLIFGSNGMLGTYIKMYFKNINIIPITRVDLDILHATRVNIKSLFDKHHVDKNTIVFNGAGLIPSASKNGISTATKDFIKINGEFPIMLAKVVHEYGAKMIHPTTDCIYDGLESGMYKESDSATEMSDYGVSKSLGDSADCTIIRTSIIGEEIRNKRSLIEWIKSNSNTTLNGYINHLWNGITCLQYAKVVEEIIEKDLFWEGVKHIYSPKPYSKYEIIKMINEVYHLNIKVIPVETKNICDKTLNSNFNLKFDIPDLRDQIIELKEFCLEE